MYDHIIYMCIITFPLSHTGRAGSKRHCLLLSPHSTCTIAIPSRGCAKDCTLRGLRPATAWNRHEVASVKTGCCPGAAGELNRFRVGHKRLPMHLVLDMLCV